MNRLTPLKRYELMRRAVAILYPNRCPFCGKVIPGAAYYCKSCYDGLPFIKAEPAPPDNISRLTACCHYRSRARGAVLMLKFSCVIYPADAFGLMMSERLKKDGFDADVIVPAPSGFLSIKKRGFSSAKVIAERVSLRLGIPICEAVHAIDDKVEQKKLTAKQRAINAKKCFYIDKEANVRGKRILLIDDVTTTGSTLSALAELLRNAGAADVVACAFAQVRACTRTDAGVARFKETRRISIPERKRDITGVSDKQ